MPARTCYRSQRMRNLAALGMLDVAPLVLKTERMSYRTLNAADGRYRDPNADPHSRREFTLDRRVEITMPRVDLGNPTPGKRFIGWRAGA